MTNTYTQNMAIRAALLNGEVITQLHATNAFGCTRLSARIWELIHRYGLPVKKKTITKYNLDGRNKTFAGYYLDSEDIKKIKEQENG